MINPCPPKRGRQVRRSKTAIKIFGYAKTRIPAEETGAGEGEEADETVRVWYPVLSVFDVSQTDPIDAPGPLHVFCCNPLQYRVTVDDP
jgi:hypothetical protein